MAKLWDNTVKCLARENPQAFVSLVLDGARFKEEVNRELIAKSIEADLMYIVTWKGKRVILHIEFQSKKDANMGRRVWEYNVLADYLTKLPVISIVIYLTRRGTIVEPPYIRRSPDNAIVQLLNYQNIKLWEVPTDRLKRPGLEVLLPLLPLTKNGKRREVVRDVIESLRVANRPDLLSISYTLAANVFRGQKDQLWLKEVYKPMRDFMEDSWAYQEIKDEGVQEGLLLGERRIFTRIVSTRFPELADLAKQQVERVNSPEIVDIAADAIINAQTAEEAKRVILQMMSSVNSAS